MQNYQFVDSYQMKTQNGSTNVKLHLVISWSTIALAAFVLAMTGITTGRHAILRNESARSVITPLLSQTIDDSWDTALHKIERTLAIEPHNHRFAQWAQWLVERKESVRSAQSIREMREDLLVLQQLNTNDVAQSLNQLVMETEDIEAQLAKAYVAYSKNDTEAARHILVEVWQNTIEDNSLTVPHQFGDWQLEGYHLTPLSVEQNALARITLYWRKIDATNKNAMMLDIDNGLYVFDDKLIQIHTSRNLIANGDMNFSPMMREQAIPFPWKLFPTFLPDPANLVSTYYASSSRMNKLTLNAQNGELLTTSLPLVPETYYLLIGEMRADVPSIYMVMQNVDSLNEFPALLPFPAGVEWQKLGAILTAKPSAYWPGVYLGPQDGFTGNLDVATVGVFEINPPGLK